MFFLEVFYIVVSYLSEFMWRQDSLVGVLWHINVCGLFNAKFCYQQSTPINPLFKRIINHNNKDCQVKEICILSRGMPLKGER